MVAVGYPSSDQIAAIDQQLTLYTPELAPYQAALRDHPGKPAETSLNALIGYLMLNAACGNRARLTNIVRVAANLDDQQRHAWGDTSPVVTYKRLRTLFTRFTRLLEAEHPNTALAHRNQLDVFITTLAETQVDASGIAIGDAVAFDGTVIRSPAKHTGKGDTLKSVDPDARVGHHPAKEGETAYAFGYEAHVAVTIGTTKRQNIPALAVAVAFQPNSTGTRPAIRDLLIDRSHRYRRAVFDAGYDFTEPNSFQTLHHHGIAPIFAPRENLRHGGIHHGKHIRDGDEYCPATPQRLLDLPLHTPGSDKTDQAKLSALYDQRARYMFERVEHTPTRSRSKCPARAGKIVCPAYPPSLHKPADTHPIEVTPPDELPPCCTQTTTSTPTHKLRRSRQGTHPYGTTNWHHAYGQRNRSEQFFSNIRHNTGTITAKNWCAVTGQTKIGLLFGIAVLVENLNTINKFKQKHGDP